MPRRRDGGVNYEEQIRSAAQVEYDVLRRKLYGRGAFGTISIMLIGVFVFGMLFFYMGLFAFPDVGGLRRYDFFMGSFVTLLFSATALVPGAIAVYRRHLVRVSKRTPQG